MKIVRHVPKRTWKSSIIEVLKMYRGKYILFVRNLIDLNMSLKDVQIQKSSLFPWYAKTTEYAVLNLRIAFNDLRISFHESIIKKLKNL